MIGSKLTAELIETYTTVLHGQEVTLKRYSAPKLEVSEEEKRKIAKLIKLIPSDFKTETKED